MGPQGLTKKQRIETLEKEVSELKLIVHELRESEAVKPSTVDVVEDKQDVQRQTVPCAAAKTPNQLRAKVIEKAKAFFEENGGSEFVFSTDVDKRSVFCWKMVSNGYGFDTLHGLSSCHPNDVFNEHISKAMALGRALKLDVSEFELAEQPTFAKGQVISFHSLDGQLVIEELTKVDGNQLWMNVAYISSTRHEEYKNADKPVIINDTNAIYEVEKL